MITKPTNLNIRASEAEKAMLAEVAAANQTTPSDMMRQLIREAYQTQKEKAMKRPIITRSNAQGEWDYLKPHNGKTLYGWNGELWTGTHVAIGTMRGVELTPITEQEREYLKSKGVLRGKV